MQVPHGQPRAYCHPNRHARHKGLCRECYDEWRKVGPVLPHLVSDTTRMISCNRCERPFKSRDPRTNRRCARCNIAVMGALSDNYNFEGDFLYIDGPFDA